MLKISRYEIRIKRYRKYLWVPLLDFYCSNCVKTIQSRVSRKKRCRWLWSVYRVFENRAIRSAFCFRPF